MPGEVAASLPSTGLFLGAIFFVLEKMAAVLGVSNPAVYAAFRGQSLDDFLKTRNTQVVYSVGGRDVGAKLSA